MVNHTPKDSASKLTICTACGMSNTYWERWPDCGNTDEPEMPYSTPLTWPEKIIGIAFAGLALIGLLTVVYVIGVYATN